MKLHLGCGPIYLQGYINIDAAPDYFSNDLKIKDILEQNSTTFDKYYKFDFCKGSGKVIADKKAMVNNLPFENETADEIIMIQVLEHIPAYEINKTLTEIYRVLKKGGYLVIGVPDIKETAKLLTKAKDNMEEDWCIRLIHGTQRNKFSHHFCGYTLRTLKKLLGEYGFCDFEGLENINFYPSIHLKAYKEGKL